MQFSLYPHKLHFRFPFRIAHGVRNTTDVVYLKLEYNGKIAWGEAALPPYLPDTQASVIQSAEAFLQTSRNNTPIEILGNILKAGMSMPCRAMIEMALVSLQAQLNNLSIAQFLAIKEKTLPQSVYTISASDSLHEMKQKLDFGLSKGFEYFKLKLIDEDVAAPINNYRALTDKPFAVDANQSWNDVQRAIANATFLKQNGCFLIEQPFRKSELQKAKDLTAENILPIYADEDCQVLSDMEQLALCYNGINIKLMKCGGIFQAMDMIKKARQLDLNVLIGCMSESSIGCDVAAVLAPLCDFADLDGPFLITNDFDESNFTS